MTNPPLLRPDVPLPTYSYVPGRFPHPISDPSGHSYQLATPDYGVFQRNSDRITPQYERGIDLFNHGYYWESHEAWEPLWHACGRSKAIGGCFFQGLIKLAAALVKAREGRQQGILRHATRAKKLFDCVQKHIDPRRACFMGLRISTLRAYCETLSQSPARFVDMRDEPMVRIGDFILSLEEEQRDA